MFACETDDDLEESIDDVPTILDMLRDSLRVQLFLGDERWTAEIASAWDALLLTIDLDLPDSIIGPVLLSLFKAVEEGLGFSCEIDSRYVPGLVIIAPASVVHASGAAGVAPPEPPSTRH